MIRTKSHIITDDALEVMKKLKNELAENGINLFSDFNVLQEDIMFTCPIHADGQERKPSCGMTTEDKGNTPAGTVHCFACGYTASVNEMVSQVFGIADGGEFGHKWLVRNFLSLAVENREVPTFDFGRGKKAKQEEVQTYVSEEYLDAIRYTHPYMAERKLTDEVIEMFDVGFDRNFKSTFGKVTPSITFPQRDMDGNVIFVTYRSVVGKHFHIPKGTSKAIYGLYELAQYGDDEIPLFIVESQIDALTVWAYGSQAVALYGTGSFEQYDMLRELPNRTLVFAFDNDRAGIKGAERAYRKLKANKLIQHVELPEGADINDLTEEEFWNLSILPGPY